MVKPLRIGNVQLASNLLLAPMAGYCDLSFRLVARSLGGVGLACTDLISCEGVIRESRNTRALAATCAEDQPLAVQLFGSDPQHMADAARWAEDNGATIVDINMGCPATKVMRIGGSMLLCDPQRTIRMAEVVAKALRHVPLTAKVRLGPDDDHIVAPQLARGLEVAGVCAVAVHGRTTAMKFSGEARLDDIARVVAAVRGIPVIGNGDVKTPEDARRMIEATGCAGVMIGRGALSAPWLFRDTWAYLSTGAIPAPPTLQEKLGYMRRHFVHLVRLRGERFAVNEFHQRIAWYAKQMNPSRMLRQRMRELRSAEEFDVAIHDFLDWRAGLVATGAGASD